MTVITASPKNFAKLLELQETANQNLSTIKSLLELSQNVQLANLVETKRIDDDGDRLEKIEKDALALEEENLKVQKEQLELLKEAEADRKEAQAAVQKVMDGMASFKTPLERIKDAMKNFGGKFSGENIKDKFLKSTNILGINDKRIEKQKFIKEQRALGVEGTKEDLSRKFEGAYAARKESSKVEEKIQKIRDATGGKFSDEELAKSSAGTAELFAKKGALADEYKQFDKGAQIKAGDKASMVSPAAAAVSPTQEFASAGEQQEAAQENAKLMGDQTSLLQKIEENTRGADSAGGAKPAAEGGGGGLLGGLGAGIKALGSGIGKGLGAILSGMGRGFMVLAKGLIALTPAIPVIGVLTLAAIGLGAALRLAAPAIEAFAPVLMKIAEVVGTVFVAAIEAIPGVIKAVGDVVLGIITGISDAITGIIESVIGSIERLANIDGGNLLAVGGGLVAIAGGLAAFGAGTAVAGVGNLVGGLLGAITPGGGPVEQIIKLGESGPNIEKAGIGVEKLAGGLTAFSSIDTEKIKAIAALPTEKIAAMGAAMGSANQVSNASKQNADADAAKSGGAGGNTAVVNAPVTTNNNTSQIIKSPVRNQESSMSKYQGSRYSRA
jgi:hypothetical protein